MKQLYKNIGIGLLIVSILLLLNWSYAFIGAAIAVPAYLPGLVASIGTYGVLVFFVSWILYTLYCIWGIVMSLKLIKTDKHSKQLYKWVYAYCVIEVLIVILNPPLGKFLYIDLITAALVYYFLIYQKNPWQKVVVGKGK